MLRSTKNSYLVLVTTPDLKTARHLAKIVLEARLAACANIVPKIESHYWWQGKITSSSENLILFKTTKNRLKLLENAILTHHPYDTPEVIVMNINAGSNRYLEWIKSSVAYK